MIITVKNKDTLIFDDFVFKCCVGKNGLTNSKIEGDKKTPKGLFKLDKLYLRNDRLNIPKTKLEVNYIKKNMGWCNDVRSKKFYNKPIKINNYVRYEKLYRHDYKYNLFIPIKYNWENTKIGRGSAIFLHLTRSYKPTAGCIGLNEKDFLILIKLIDKKTKLKII
tara:strand:- start:583 stop:1077 length:495 start_codon:yes stop_codon:yes gene_type:complete